MKPQKSPLFSANPHGFWPKYGKTALFDDEEGSKPISDLLRAIRCKPDNTKQGDTESIAKIVPHPRAPGSQISNTFHTSRSAPHAMTIDELETMDCVIDLAAPSNAVSRVVWLKQHSRRFEPFTQTSRRNMLLSGTWLNVESDISESSTQRDHDRQTVEEAFQKTWQRAKRFQAEFEEMKARRTRQNHEAAAQRSEGLRHEDRAYLTTIVEKDFIDLCMQYVENEYWLRSV